MSRVYFHSPSTPAAELRGSERAYAGMLCSSLALSVIEPDGFDTEKRLRAWLPADHYLHGTAAPHFARSWATAFRVGDGPLIVRDGEPLDVFGLTLNTAIVLGNDAVRFLARLHGQCEIHGFVEGPNRAWLADIIAAGRASGIYRADQGWEAVATLLTSRNDEPVVMSYSVCEQFPHAGVGNWMPPWPDGVPRDWGKLTDEQQREREQRQEAWYELPRDEQWARSLAGIRADAWLELKPSHWADYRFGHNLSAFDLR